MKTKIYLFFLVAFLIFSCGKTEKKKTIWVDKTTISKEDSCEIVEIPFFERNNIIYVEVKLCGDPVDMIFDTGSSRCTISPEKAQLLHENGMLEFLGKSNSWIADGSIVENQIVRFKKLKLHEKLVFEDVTAAVFDNPNAPLLLGNDIINQMIAHEIDNERKVIKFTVKKK